jgi:hypothetical protein
MYFVNNATGAFHIWRQRFPDGRPEQLTAGPTEEEGLAISPDGSSLVTAVGNRRVAVILHDGETERPIASEGRPRLAQVQNGSGFSRDGKKLYYLRPSRISNDIGTAMLTSYTVGELWATDLSTGQSEAVFPGLDVMSFGLAPDGNRIAFATSDLPRPRLWIATLDRGSSPRQLPVEGAESVRFAGDYIYYQTRERDGPTTAVRPVLHRIRPDGTGDETIRTPEYFRSSVSSSGRLLALTTRQNADAQILRLAIVDPQKVVSTPVCSSCAGWWSDDGNWFAITRQGGSGDRLGAIYLLPTWSGTELPDLPPGGFVSVEDAARAKGVRVVNQAGEVALSTSPERYAFVREIVHRNLFRIPLR